MLKVLHLYPHDNDMLTQYVGMVQRVMGAYDGDAPDIVHVHGCWNHDVVRTARRYGLRMVLSPHGQLQPWVTAQETLAKAQAWQRRHVARCYAVVAQGPMEASNLQQLGWNPRLETVRNPIVTATISEEEACRQLGAVYRKVMDSNPWPLMPPDSRAMLARLLKAGITGDRRWLNNYQLSIINYQLDWRQLLNYAHQEHVEPIVRRGIEVLGLTDVPPTDTAAIAAYLPANYDATPQTLTDAVAIVAALRQRPTLRLLCDLHAALHRDDTDDARLADALKQKRLLNMGRRLMAVMAELTLLDEGFMPFAPLNDKQTTQIRTAIAENLKI